MGQLGLYLQITGVTIFKNIAYPKTNLFFKHCTSGHYKQSASINHLKLHYAWLELQNDSFSFQMHRNSEIVKIREGWGRLHV